MEYRHNQRRISTKGEEEFSKTQEENVKRLWISGKNVDKKETEKEKGQKIVPISCG